MKTKQRGFTIIELLITLAISGTLIAGIGQILLQSKQTYKTQQALSLMMEDGRYILETLTKETRRMGYLRNKTASPEGQEAVGGQEDLFVLDDGGDGSGALGSGVTLKKGEYIHGDYNAYGFDGTPYNDNRLIFRYQLNDACDLGDCADTSSATSPCTRDIGLELGDDPTVDRHVVTVYLYVEFDPVLKTPVLYCEAKRDVVTQISLGQNPDGSTIDIWLATTARTSAKKPLLSNVEKLLMLYGVDTPYFDVATDEDVYDNATNFYRRADEVSIATDCGSEEDRITPTSCWKHITSIKLYAVLRSEETHMTQNDSSYQIDGQTVPADVPGDRRLYRVFSTTITPRVSNASST
jgi:prepilin-type N-terminal cleavage/methylation domain-containing protein